MDSNAPLLIPLLDLVVPQLITQYTTKIVCVLQNTEIRYDYRHTRIGSDWSSLRPMRWVYPKGQLVQCILGNVEGLVICFNLMLERITVFYRVR